MSDIETQGMFNRKWASLAIADFRDGADRLVNLAIHLPDSLSESAFDFADTLETWAVRLENAIENKSNKRQSKAISEFRRTFNDNVLNAISGYYDYLESYVDYKAVFSPEHFEID